MFLEEFARSGCERFHFADGTRNSTRFPGKNEVIANSALSARTGRETLCKFDFVDLVEADRLPPAGIGVKLERREVPLGAEKKGGGVLIRRVPGNVQLNRVLYTNSQRAVSLHPADKCRIVKNAST